MKILRFVLFGNRAFTIPSSPDVVCPSSNRGQLCTAVYNTGDILNTGDRYNRRWHVNYFIDNLTELGTHKLMGDSCTVATANSFLNDNFDLC
jgi:hypothetical protein